MPPARQQAVPALQLTASTESASCAETTPHQPNSWHAND
jgi:hypothetical protein